MVQRWEGNEHVAIGDANPYVWSQLRANGGRASAVALSGSMLTEAHLRVRSQHGEDPQAWPDTWPQRFATGSPAQRTFLRNGLSYGQVVALSGDLYATPEDLRRAPLLELYDLVGELAKSHTTTSRLEEITGGRYLALAATNHTHFSYGGENMRLWTTLHIEAIRAAAAARSSTELANALRLNAFADHFLSDAFAGGHLVIDRAALASKGLRGHVESRILHNLQNRIGLPVVNSRGDQWVAFGDGFYDDPRNRGNKLLMQQALAWSRWDIAEAAAGRDPTTGAGKIFQLVPRVDYSLAPWHLLAHSNDGLLEELSGSAGELVELIEKPGTPELAAFWVVLHPDGDLDRLGDKEFERLTEAVKGAAGYRGELARDKLSASANRRTRSSGGSAAGPGSGGPVPTERSVELNRRYATQLGWGRRFETIVWLWQHEGLIEPGRSPSEAELAVAVLRYQQRAGGLMCDGILGPHTWASLRPRLRFSVEPGGSSPAVPPAMAGPRVPADLSHLVGTLGYYRARYRDFAGREPYRSPPDYYLVYGEKYARRFTQVLRPKLSRFGQRWVDRTFELLQEAIETRRRRDPAGFAVLERDGAAFRSFAFETHADAYVSAGVCFLPQSDQMRIMATPDVLDVVPGGLGQIADVIGSCVGEWAGEVRSW
jgi:hypothetical protein